MMAEKTIHFSHSLSMLLEGMVVVSEVDDRQITGISIDSRLVQPGDLFIACQGQKDDGCEFIDDAVKAGAIAVIWESSKNVFPLQIAKYLNSESGMCVLVVENLKNKISEIASRFFDQPSKDLFVIAVTGTNGKTSCSHFLSQVLNKESSCGLIGTLGYGVNGNLKQTHMTTPDPVSLQLYLREMLDSGAEKVVVEFSSHGLEQGRANGVDVDVAVFTNLSRDHLDYHDDMAAYSQAKKKLFDMPGVKHAVINADDEFGRQLLQGMDSSKQCLSYGIESSVVQPDVFASNIIANPRGLCFDVETPWGKGQVQSELLGRFNVSNLLAVLGALLASGNSLESSLKNMQQIKTVPGRMQRLGGESGLPLVVVDYAHTPDALKQVLSTLKEHSDGQLFCMFGCGGDRDSGKRSLMGEVVNKYADEVIITDDNPRFESPAKIIEDILEGMSNRDKVTVIHDRARAIETLVSRAEHKDIVLIAGKGHEDYQVIGNNKVPFSDSDQVKKLLDSFSSSANC